MSENSSFLIAKEIPTYRSTSHNPYHSKLDQFRDFVLKDLEAESFKGHWNESVFHRQAPLHVEIGTGHGHFMAEYCQKNPENNFIGLDYRFKRSFYVASKLALIPHRNFRYLRAWAERLEHIFAEDEVDSIYYFFPDPWPKNRHHKKRLFRPQYLQALHYLMRPGGEIFIKTDHDELFEWIVSHFHGDEKDLFEIEFQTRDLKFEYPGHFLSSFETKFEKIFIKQGIKIKALVLKSKKTPLNQETQEYVLNRS